MVRDATPTAVQHHVYRDDLSALDYAHSGTCRDDLDLNRTDTQLEDSGVPAAGHGFYYLVTADDGAGREGTLGSATSAERSNYNPCP